MKITLFFNVTVFCCVLCDLDPKEFPNSFQALEQEYCMSTYRCGGNVTLPDNCRCDTDCVVYGDCCPGDVNEKPEKAKVIPKFTCEYREDIDPENFIYIVNSCPRGADTELKNKCENVSGSDVFERIPVSGQKSGFLYKNMYCALCNVDNYVIWNPGILCKWKYTLPEKLKVSLLLNDTNCRVTYSPPKGNLTQRTCFPITTAESCQNEILMTSCKFGNYAPVFGLNIAYRNTDCARCQNFPELNLTCNFKSSQLIPSKTKRKIYNFSYRVLFDLNSKQELSETRFRSSVQNESTSPLSSICDRNHLLDPFTDQCYKIVCKPPFIYQNGKCLLKEGFTNDPNITSCISRLFRQNEFKKVNSSSIFVFSLSRTITNFTLEKNETVAYVCINESKIDDPLINTRLTTDFSKEESLLSFIGGILSITCLFVCLIVYFCSSKLHNVPGKNLMCLMASLLVAQLLFLLAPFIFEIKNQSLCEALSIFTHFSFLAAFFWMNVMSFDIFFTFSKGFINLGERGSTSKRFRFYSIYAWLGTFIVVGTATLVNYTSDSSLRPAYGRGFCWISNSRGLLVFFLVPIAILLLSNIIFFIVSAKSIHTSSKKTSRVLQKKDACKLFIYIKLSVVMGLTWCFGFLASVTNHVVTWYLFIFFNTLQGFFIAVFFVCTKKVFRIVRDGATSFYSNTRSFTLTKSMNSKSESEEYRNHVLRKYKATEPI
ncbi:adhesion G-protein coupled receptor G6-like [Saccostrea echinata]|uniref:adhesion G-protein coupled receptor G6-like n=1 Tax=Saccostrea echinata TaxID=191078 RepID=UPI002A7F4BBB|nr:adhesion G-protein coupled receptor G6-like [Saccostrea echinata]